MVKKSVLQLRIKKNDFLSGRYLRSLTQHEGNMDMIKEAREKIRKYKTVYEYSRDGKILTITGPVTIGRDGMVLINDNRGKISREHCMIFYKNRTWQIKDLNSSNGTYRIRSGQGRELTPQQPYVLRVGDNIQLAVSVPVIMEVINL